MVFKPNSGKLLTYISILAVIILSIVVFIKSSPVEAPTIETGGDRNPALLEKTSEINEEKQGKQETIEVSRSHNSRYSHLPHYDIPLDLEFRNFVYKQSAQANFSYELILAIMYIESRFNKNTISSTNDHGICQLNSTTWNWIKKQIDVDDPYNEYHSVSACIYYLSYLRDKILDRYPRVSDEQLFNMLVSAYNTGETQLFNGYINYNYINNVYSAKERLERDGVI